MKSLIFKWNPSDYLSGANHWRNNCVHHCIGDSHLTNFDDNRRKIQKKIKRKGNVTIFLFDTIASIAVAISSEMLYTKQRLWHHFNCLTSNCFMVFFFLWVSFAVYVYMPLRVYEHVVKVSLCYCSYCPCFAILILSFVIVPMFFSCMWLFQPFNGWRVKSSFSFIHSKVDLKWFGFLYTRSVEVIKIYIFHYYYYYYSRTLCSILFQIPYRFVYLCLGVLKLSLYT